MSPKNSNSVAAERRMDLASLFCMIGRHGPAVVVAVIAMVSVLAGFIIYRIVRGKRRKATDAAADSAGKSPGAERDASVNQLSLDESHSSVEATEVSDEGSPEVQEDVDLIKSDLKIRHRCAAAAAVERKPPTYFPSKSYIHVPENKHTTSDDIEERAGVWDSCGVAEVNAKDASLQSDTNTEAEKVKEDAVDYHQCATDDIIEDVIEEVHDDNSCLKEPEEIIDVNHKEEETVLKAKYQDELVTTEKNASDRKTRQEEESNYMSENDDVNRPQDNETTVETNSMDSILEKPAIHNEDTPVSCICYADVYNQLPPNEEKGNECEVEEKCMEYQPTPQLAEMLSTTNEQETNLPSTQHDASDNVTDKIMLPIQDNNWDKESGPPEEDHMNNLIAVDTDSTQFNEKEVDIKKDENGFTYNKENSVLDDDADLVEEKRLICEDIVASTEECQSASFETISPLSCLSEPIEAQMLSHETDNEPENNKNDPTVELTEECTDDVYEPDVRSCLEEQLRIEMIRNKDFDNAGPDVVAPDGENMTSPIMAEEISLPHVSSCYREQQSIEITNDEVSDQASVAAVPGTDENIPSSETVEEIPHPHQPSICQDQECDQTENENLHSTRFSSAPDTTACNDVCLTAFLMAEELSFPDVLSSPRDQQIDHMENTETFDETGVSSSSDTPACNDVCLTAHLVAEEIYFSDVLSSSQDQQNDRMEETENCDEIGDTSASDEPASDEPAGNNANLTALLMSDEISCPDVLPSSQDQQKDRMEETENYEIGVTSASDEPSGSDANLTALLMFDEVSCPDVLPSSLEQSHHMKNTETFNEMSINSATDTPVFDNASITSPTICEEISQSDMLFSCQYQLSDQAKNNEDCFEASNGGPPPNPVMTVDINPSTIYLPSFEQSELVDNDLSSPGVGKESGISSMAVSPDLQNASYGFGINVENMVIPVIHCDLPSSVAQMASHNNVFAIDSAASYNNENTAGMVFGPYPSHHPQPPYSEHTDWAKYESSAANEDTFGHEVENSYHREMNRFMAQIVDSATSIADELKGETDMKAVAEVLEIKELKAQVSVEKKKDIKAEEDEEAVDFEKTEISIMEATMDNNEWITDTNYPVLPWMNLSAPSMAQNQIKTIQPPTEESSVVKDVCCINTTDDHLSTESKQTSTLSPVDEISESNKKIVAVQPMPQNVNVTFRVHYFTQSPYQTVAITGSQQELGNWKGFIPLERAKDGHWATVVSLPTESHVEWKFVLLDKGEVCRWEECGNRLLDTGFGDDLIVHKWWGFL